MFGTSLMAVDVSSDATSPPRSRIKIGVLIGTLEMGGAEQDIVRNFPRLNRDEFEVVVILFGHPGVLAPELERRGIPVIARRPDPQSDSADRPGAPRGVIARMVHAVPDGLKRPVRKTLGWLLAVPPVAWLSRTVGAALYIALVTRWIGRTFKAEQLDIAHFFLPHSYVYGMFACRLWRPRAKRVMSRLSLNFYRDSHRLISALESHLLHRRVDVAVGNTRSILAELVEEGVDSARVRLLHNGVDLTRFEHTDEDRRRARAMLGLDGDVFAVVAVGNLHTYKGHRDLIEACAEARDALPRRWRLLLAGRDETGNRAAYETLASELGIADNVRLLGACEDVPRLLWAADLFVQPSHHEGLPNAVIEAMAASLPVIGTSVGGIPEVVATSGSATGDSTETGWLVPPHDPGALSQALIEAANDQSRRVAMGRSGRSRAVAEFSIERSVADYEALYRDLMAMA